LVKYYIIEKDIATINSIKEVLKDFSDFICIGASGDHQTSMNTILREAPKLVFINIDKVIENPFQLTNEIKQILENVPEFIAISTLKENAYCAIKNSFFDFLLQPLSELEIRKTILKFQKIHLPELKSNICLKSYKDYQYLNTNEILFLKADNNTTDFFMKDGNTIGSYKTLKTFEGLLPDNFLRIHKSYIINSNYVSRINYGKLMCTIKREGYKIPFTKTYMENIEIINKALFQYSLSPLN